MPQWLHCATLQKLVGYSAGSVGGCGSRGILGSPVVCGGSKLSKYSLAYLSNLSRGLRDLRKLNYPKDDRGVGDPLRKYTSTLS